MSDSETTFSRGCGTNEEQAFSAREEEALEAKPETVLPYDDNYEEENSILKKKLEMVYLGEDHEDCSLPKRESWTTHTEFILSMVGACVGLGNVWRFPYLCYKNGGGAFLVPYLVAALCTGIPMFLLEVSMGQYHSATVISSWSAVCPPFRGIGIGGTVMCFISNVYYIVVISWTAFYFYHSLTTRLPWAVCDNPWNLKSCVTITDLPQTLCTKDPQNLNNLPSHSDDIPMSQHVLQQLLQMHRRSGHLEMLAPANQTWLPSNLSTASSGVQSGVSPTPHLFPWTSTWINNSREHDIFKVPEVNLTTIFTFSQLKARHPMAGESDVHCLVNREWILASNITEPVREFWERKVLQISSGLEMVGSLNIDMTVTFVLCWVICYFCIWKGIRWTGKVVYFTALMPYLLLFILLCQSLTLPGCMTGLRYFIVPDMAKLKDVEVWLAAVTQVFYSYALAFGSLVTFGSFNKFNTNCYRDSLMIAAINSSTSVLSGVIVFAVVGFMSHEQNKPVEEVALSGPGLAFLVYPSAANGMPLPWLWSAIFFFTLFIIGLDSEFCCVESVIASITDQYPRQLRPHKELFTAAVCLLSCLLGLTCLTEGGMYVFQLMDAYACSGLCLVWFVFWSSIAMGWGYGGDRWNKCIETMIGFNPGRWWPFCWKFLVPTITLLLFIFNAAMWQPLRYVTYEYSVMGNLLGWLLALASMVWVPGYFLYYTVHFLASGGQQDTWTKTLKHFFRPDSEVQTPEQRTSSL